jgi:hypothetical protein
VTDFPVEKFDFETLATSIQSVHTELARQASKAVNITLTLRNWMIGYYIAEYELRGSDRAEYGGKVLERLSERLTILTVGSCDKRRLEQYRQFYRAYPQIARTASTNSSPPSNTGRFEGNCDDGKRGHAMSNFEFLASEWKDTHEAASKDIEPLIFTNPH